MRIINTGRPASLNAGEDWTTWDKNKTSHISSARSVRPALVSKIKHVLAGEASHDMDPGNRDSLESVWSGREKKMWTEIRTKVNMSLWCAIIWYKSQAWIGSSRLSHVGSLALDVPDRKERKMVQMAVKLCDPFLVPSIISSAAVHFSLRVLWSSELRHFPTILSRCLTQ